MKNLLIILITVFLIQPANSQHRWRNIVSPEVHPDKTVTFRLLMPDAKEVKLSSQLEKDTLMIKDTSGLWSITVGPVKPDIYPYSFLVDGVRIMDPNNLTVFPNERFKSSLVDIPGNVPLIHSIQDVPHGIVWYMYYNSKTLNTTRPLVIYTPPDYEQNKDKNYPVLYLIHGMTDTEETWYKVGRVNFILDNLIQMGKAEPMIIVMPYANTYSSDGKNPENLREEALKTNLFNDDMINDIIPFVESNYRVTSNKENRAIAGFSLGGRQTLAIGLANTEMFSWVSGYAPAIWANEIEGNFNNLYDDTKALNGLKLFSLSCGTDDHLYNSTLEFTKLLTDKDIKYKTYFIPGGHTWMNCKLFLAETVQQLFKY